MIIDTHAHLYWDSFKKDLAEIIQRAVSAGITGAINVGVDVKTSQLALDQLNSLQGLTAYSSIGIHPHEVLRLASLAQDKPDIDVSIQQDTLKLEAIYRQNPQKIIAVGECGLDYFFKDIDHHVANAPRDDVIASEAWQSRLKTLQRQLFRAQINLAKKLNLPLLIHCRDDRSQNPTNCECWNEVVQMTKDHFGVYHCYSGLLPTTNYLLQTTTFYISFAGNLTYPKNEYLRQAVKIIPLERILVETDCPFLPPQKYRGQRNEPSYIKEILQTIAQIKNISIEKVESAIFANTARAFKI